MNRTVALLAGLVTALPVLVYALSQTDATTSSWSPRKAKSAASLSIFCAASNRAVMEAIASDYRRDSNDELLINYGPSEGLLSQIEVTGTGDLYLPADVSYLEKARDKGLVGEIFPIAVMRVIVIVAANNPKQIHCYADLLREDVRLVQANPDAAAVGSLTRSILGATDKWESLDRATKAYRGNVTEVANDVVIGSADAGLIYDAMMHNYPELHSVELPEFESAIAHVAIGMIANSDNVDQARGFVDYLRSEEHGRRRYREYGFRLSEQ